MSQNTLYRESFVRFLESECSQPINPFCIDILNTHNFDECLGSVLEAFNLDALADLNEEDSVHASLQLIETDNSELWFCKCKYSLLMRLSWSAMNLRNGEIQTWDLDTFLNKRSKFTLLFENFQPTKEIDEKTISHFLLDPIKHLSVPLLFLTLFSGMLQSMLFISVFYTLDTVVPLGEKSNFHSIFLLVAGILVCLLFVDLIHTRLQNRFNSELQKRKSFVEYALLWKVPPWLMQKYGADQVAAHISTLCRLSELRWSLKQQLMSCLILIPILFLMYIRMPFVLFMSSLFIVAVYLIALRKRSQTPSFEPPSSIYSVMADLPILDYFSQLPLRLALWQKQSSVENQIEIKEILIDQELSRWQFALKNAGLVLVMIVGALAIKNAAPEQALEGVQAFMLIFLTGNLLNIAPRMGDISRQNSMYLYLKKTIVSFLDEMNESFNVPESQPYKKTELQISGIRIGQQKIDLTVKKGSFLAIKCGNEKDKNTLVSQLLGLSIPENGKILISGLEAHKLSLPQRQSLINFVSLDSSLIDGSLKHNLFLFSDKKTQAIERQLWTVLEWLEIDKLIERLPLGLDTPISQVEHGFSTGELQRLVVAQTLMKKSKIVFIDNALAGLPEDQELRILKRIVEHYEIVVCFTLHNGLRDHVSAWEEIITLDGEIE